MEPLQLLLSIGEGSLSVIRTASIFVSVLAAIFFFAGKLLFLVLLLAMF